MSQAFDLITSQGNRLILNKESLSYLSQIKDEVVLVTLISSTDDNNLLGNIKLSLISSMTNSKMPDSNNIGATFYTSNLRKENSGAVVLFANMKSSNKHLLSLLFLSSSLFVFCIDEEIKDQEINKFLNINCLGPNYIIIRTLTTGACRNLRRVKKSVQKFTQDQKFLSPEFLKKEKTAASMRRKI